MPLWGKRERSAPATPELPPGLDPAAEQRWGLTDPAAAVAFGGTINNSGQPVYEGSLLSLSAVYRAVSVISQTAGTLPLKSYRELPDGSRKRETSFLDNPAGPDALMSPFQWKEMVFLHLLLNGEADLYHVRNEAGALVGLQPVHPSAVSVKLDADVRGGESYTVSLDNGENVSLTPFGRTKDDPGMTRIVGPRTRGLRGWSPMSKGATSFGIGLAAEKATATLFRKGALIQGALVPRAGEDVSSDDAAQIRDDLDRHLHGPDSAGKIPLVNRALEFASWQMTNVDAQFLENRQFQIEEIARWFGVPPFMLMQLDKQTSWGTGISEQNKNLAQHVLQPWCKRIEEHLSRLLPQPRWCEFDFYALTSGSAKDEQDLLLGSVNGGLRTLNEARRILNLPPVPGGDELRIPSGVMLQAQLEANAAATEADTDAGSAAPEGEQGGA